MITWLESSLCLYGEGSGRKVDWANRKEGGRLGVVGVELGCGGKRPFYGPLVGVCWGKSVLKKLGGSLLPLSKCRRGFHVLLKFRPSSLFMLCGCSSSSMASLMRRSKYPDVAERSLVS
jgi:hypothetical protein